MIVIIIFNYTCIIEMKILQFKNAQSLVHSLQDQNEKK